MEIKITSNRFRDPDAFRGVAYERFPTSSDAFLRVFADLLWRACAIEEDNPNWDFAECVMEAVSEGLIYTADQWCVMQNYQTPDEANYQSAINSLVDDLVDAL